MTGKNCYLDLIHGRFYADCPKAVFAAMAVSFATSGGDHPECATAALTREWWALYDSGIVPQKPTIPRLPDEGLPHVLGQMPPDQRVKMLAFMFATLVGSFPEEATLALRGIMAQIGVRVEQGDTMH